ncbi:fructose-bisphosphate aldolase [Pseudomonas helmanticensis]|uniref:fructose-bisphosphate aldolase n=1 Tax=Pseudomonas helmanticensis TaxID=1471381 RepID=UPI00381481C6
MTIKTPLHHYAHMSHPATDHPVLLIDANAPRRDLHACAAKRLNAVLKYLDLIACTRLSDHAEHEINTVTKIAKIMLQDANDVFWVIELRRFDSPVTEQHFFDAESC